MCDSHTHTSCVQNITQGVLFDSAGYWQSSTKTRVNISRTMAVNQDTARTERTTEGYFIANCWAIDEKVSHCDQHYKLTAILSEEGVLEDRVLVKIFGAEGEGRDQGRGGKCKMRSCWSGGIRVVK